MTKHVKISLVLTADQKKLLRLHMRMRLQIELVPASSHCRNVRSNLSKSDWDKIRREVYTKAGHRCEICGKQGTRHPVECHEFWTYNQKTGVQKLKAFIENTRL